MLARPELGNEIFGGSLAAKRAPAVEKTATDKMLAAKAKRVTGTSTDTESTRGKSTAYQFRSASVRVAASTMPTHPPTTASKSPSRRKWPTNVVGSAPTAAWTRGIVQLAEAIDLKKHLPDDLDRTLPILFEYRDKMFHCGLEWPDIDRKEFANLIAPRGWSDCFTRTEPGSDPWSAICKGVRQPLPRYSEILCTRSSKASARAYVGCFGLTIPQIVEPTLLCAHTHRHDICLTH